MCGRWTEKERERERERERGGGGALSLIKSLLTDVWQMDKPTQLVANPDVCVCVRYQQQSLWLSLGSSSESEPPSTHHIGNCPMSYVCCVCG